MFTKDLGANVTLYGQESCCWCGASSAQMSRNGYPVPADRLFYTQLVLWNSIQVHNSADPADSGWCTDPHGLQGCLQAAANPAGVHWSEFANASRDGLLFSTLYLDEPPGVSNAYACEQGRALGRHRRLDDGCGAGRRQCPVLQSIHYTIRNPTMSAPRR